MVFRQMKIIAKPFNDDLKGKFKCFAKLIFLEEKLSRKFERVVLPMPGGPIGIMKYFVI